MDTRVIGCGSQQVYLYYYQAYKTVRLMEGHYDWPCKIGFATGDARLRIKHQVQTSSPEKPVIGLIVKTDDAYLLEQALHAILRLNHKDVKNASGEEWFVTTPDEVKMLCQMLRRG